MIWWAGAGLIVLWAVLYFVANKTGLVHLFLLSGISVFFVQVLAYRKTKHHQKVSGKSKS
jgi:membrane protein implicated in regulation of membrane protease activity